MNTVVKLLVAATCVVVLAVAGVWWSDRSAAMQRDAEAKAHIAQARSDLRRKECSEMVDAWDAGDKQSALAEFGGKAEEIVSNCRYLIEIPR